MKNTKQKGFTLPRNVNAEGGFTLIELLIVIGIIAILAAAVIIAINPGQQFQQARNATRWSHMNSVANAVYSYAIEEGGTFPDCIDITGNIDDDPADLSDCSGDLANHISELPMDPSVGGSEYTYNTYTCPENADATSADDCVGYLIFSDGTRIKIVSAADEADEIEVIQ